MNLSNVLAYICFSFIIGSFNAVPMLTSAYGFTLVESVVISVFLVAPVLILLALVDEKINKITFDKM